MDIESDAGFIQALQLQNDTAAADRRLAVRFYTEEFLDEEATKIEGRPIYKTWECCEIRIPGDEKNIRQGRIKYMKPDPRERFPEAYRKFKAGDRSQVTGQLLKAWGLITPARAKEYSALGIYTVEQLASLSDSNAQNIRGSIPDRQKAKDFLEMAKGQAPVAQARAEADKLRVELEVLKEQIAALQEKEPSPKKKPGRKPNKIVQALQDTVKAEQE